MEQELVAPDCRSDCSGNGRFNCRVVTRPFSFEGAQRRVNAEAGIRELERCRFFDSGPNDKLLEMATKYVCGRIILIDRPQIWYLVFLIS